MKTFIGAAIIGVLLIAGGFVFDMCIENFSEEMLLKCEEFDSTDEKNRKIEEINLFLEKKKILLASIINHQGIDEIETCIAEIKGYLEEGDVSEAEVRCKKLKLLLKRLPMEYGLSLQNIL